MEERISPEQVMIAAGGTFPGPVRKRCISTVGNLTLVRSRYKTLPSRHSAEYGARYHLKA